MRGDNPGEVDRARGGDPVVAREGDSLGVTGACLGTDVAFEVGGGVLRGSSTGFFLPRPNRLRFIFCTAVSSPPDLSPLALSPPVIVVLVDASAKGVTVEGCGFICIAALGAAGAVVLILETVARICGFR